MTSVLLLNYRSGSSLLLALLGIPWRIHSANGDHERATKTKNSLMGRCSVQSAAGNNYSKPRFKEITAPGEVIQDKCLYSSYMGDWWGDLSSAFIPEPYGNMSPTSWNYQVLNLKKFEETAFVGLIRDGRNYVASMMNIKGGVEEQKMRWDERDYFQVLCKGWRNRARIFIDNQNMCKHFRIYKFEDLVENPIEQTREILELGLRIPADVSKIRENFSKITNVANHSSFDEAGNYNNRWKNFNTWQKNMFMEIAGKELEELEYNVD